jgi:predicted Zn-dependent protease
MTESLPELDREKLMQELLAEAERTVNDVADAVDNAAVGHVIADSEEPARDALDRFRQVVYERVLQAKVDAAEAAFPPSPQRSDGQEETT